MDRRKIAVRRLCTSAAIAMHPACLRGLAPAIQTIPVPIVRAEHDKRKTCVFEDPVTTCVPNALIGANSLPRPAATGGERAETRQDCT
jgi:hypothetical protein